jgi:3-oxoacyl-[acyl-carrier protein] reductase
LLSLNDQVILITGASKGLGKSMALLAAKKGAHVIFTYAHNDQAANETLDELKNISAQNHMAHKVDSSCLKSNLEFSKLIKEKYGRLNCLINNAGISEFLPLALLDEEDWDKLSDIT